MAKLGRCTQTLIISTNIVKDTMQICYNKILYQHKYDKNWK